jgi:stalled ribosome rescue protein Dom34
MTASSEKIRKIRTLAERGATEGERAAAREALRRIEVAQPQRHSAVEVNTETIDQVIEQMSRENKVWRDLFQSSFAQSKAPHHHGRVWFDRS